MTAHQEIEIKFRVENARLLSRKLKAAGFRLITPRTHEMNTLYDLPSQPLRRRGDLLRLRQYGKRWVLTHKSKGTEGRHKIRTETETEVSDGPKMEQILHALGYEAVFHYEKFRAEWSDGKGHVVVDHTPIGDFGEIEGPARWIDATAKKLAITPAYYLAHSYTELFFAWKSQTGSHAEDMTFKAVGIGAKSPKFLKT
jgi:adenylate cyclase, class 2